MCQVRLGCQVKGLLILTGSHLGVGGPAKGFPSPVWKCSRLTLCKAGTLPTDWQLSPTPTFQCTVQRERRSSQRLLLQSSAHTKLCRTTILGSCNRNAAGSEEKQTGSFFKQSEGGKEAGRAVTLPHPQPCFFCSVCVLCSQTDIRCLAQQAVGWGERLPVAKLRFLWMEDASGFSPPTHPCPP